MKEKKLSALKDPYLVNELSVADARRLLEWEGTSLSLVEAVTELAMIFLTAGLVARAIWSHDATLWHLILPLVAQYMTHILSMVVFQAFYRLPNMRANILKCFFNIGLWLLVVGAGITARAWSFGHAWMDQYQADRLWLWNWIADHEMHWPILAAGLGYLVFAEGRFRKSYTLKIPLESVSLGCAIKLILAVVALFIGPWFFTTPEMVKTMYTNGVWFVWGLIVSADLLAFYMLHDIRKRLKKIDTAAKQNQPSEASNE